MIGNVLGAFLDTVTEREFDAPLAELLRGEGFAEIHHIHGQYEAGKDFVAQRELDSRLTQYGLQSKAGDLGLKLWREAKMQIDQIRTNGSGHPGFNRDLPRRGVLVTTGHLTGGAGVDAQEYREHVERTSEFRFEVWDRERLLEDMLRNPTISLAGGVEGPLLTVLGKIDEHNITDQELEQFTRRWVGDVGALPRASVECAIVATRCRAERRVDQAALVALGLLRAGWETVHGADEVPAKATAALSAARRLFATYAAELLEAMTEQHLKPAGLIDEHPDVSFPVTYQVRSIRLAEIIALYALLLVDEKDTRADAVVDRLVAFVRAQPGVTHPISDRWAVSLIPIVAVVARRDRALVESVLRESIRWTADHYDPKGQWSLGLARPAATPTEEIEQLLGGPLGHVKRARRDESYLATVLIDLAGLLGFQALYADAINDFEAVRAAPVAYEISDTVAQYGGPGPGLVRYPRVPYSSDLSAAPLAPHHLPADTYYVHRVAGSWDLLAMSALLRDRHWTSAISLLS